jgi:hypothetical protein
VPTNSSVDAAGLESEVKTKWKRICGFHFLFPPSFLHFIPPLVPPVSGGAMPFFTLCISLREPARNIPVHWDCGYLQMKFIFGPVVCGQARGIYRLRILVVSRELSKNDLNLQ